MQIIKTIVDFVFAIGLFVNGFLMLPQIIKLCHVKNSKNLSLISYIGFDIFLLGMMLHGILYNDVILTLGMSFGLIMNSVLIGATTFYRFKPRHT